VPTTAPLVSLPRTPMAHLALWRRQPAHRAAQRITLALSLVFVVGACDDDDDSPTDPGESSVLVFSSDRDGNFEIYSANADGSDVRRLTTSAGDDGEPSWSTTGRIAFSSVRDGNLEI